uniref:Transposase n=1 Tax=Knipowitschia caucasica TaxID=637954 RepID=A0AAV2JC47_KNICA
MYCQWPSLQGTPPTLQCPLGSPTPSDACHGSDRISYQDTNYRRSIPAEERLSICLRFLATGDSYRTIAGSFRAGISTVSMLIPDVVAAIWDCLVEEFMAVPGAEEWR